MSSTTPGYLTNDPIDTYVPIPFPSSFPRSDSSAPSTNTSGNSGQDGDTVYAAALFLKAYCKKADVVGAWVRADDAPSTVTTTNAGLSYPAIGVIVTKTSDTTCVVQTYGLCGGIYSGLTPNVRLFVGPTGQAASGSELPSGTAYVQPIGFSVRSDTIFVQPSGTLYRRDAVPDANDPAPAPAGDESTSTYRPVLCGTDEPDDSIGQVDDLYLQAGNPLLLWGPKDASGWGSSRPLATSSAGTGEQGEQGEPGSAIVRVASFPADASAYRAGDVLIDDEGNLAQVENA